MALAYTRRRLSSSAREALYDRCRGDAEVPDCNICGLPIRVGDAWHESHDPEGPPHCFGGTETGVAHRDCNLRHGAEVVVPMDAKATRIRQKHIGAFQTRHKMPCGRDSRWKKSVDGRLLQRREL
jgi:5-methylcytosine-specific restriction protein A